MRARTRGSALYCSVKKRLVPYKLGSKDWDVRSLCNGEKTQGEGLDQGECFSMLEAFLELSLSYFGAFSKIVPKIGPKSVVVTEAADFPN